MKIFVTGATGLVGTRLVKELYKLGHEVICLVKDLNQYREFNFGKGHLVFGDIRDKKLLVETINENNVDVVVHLAAQALVPAANRCSYSTFETNIQGTLNILEALTQCQNVKHSVMFTTDKVYGEHEEACTEDTILDGYAPYEVSKICADLLCQSFMKFHNLSMTIFRCGNIFGEGDLNWDRIIPGIAKARYGKSNKLEIRSNGKNIRDYIYVRDVVAAILFAITEKLDGIYNISYSHHGIEKGKSVMDLVNNCPTIQYTILDNAQKELNKQIINAAKLWDTGWRPVYGFRQGWELTMNWYAEYFNRGTG